MRWLIRWCLHNRTVVVLFNLILMGAGAASLPHLGQALLPSVDLPVVSILVPEPGASSEQVDRDVARPLSAALAGLAGELHVTTDASQGFLQAYVVFGLDSSVSADLAAVNQRAQQLALPAAAGHPTVTASNAASTSPAIVYSLAARDGDLSRATGEVQDVIVPALTGATGATQVRAVGGSRPVVTITLDGTSLAARRISMQQVRQALAGAQVDVPAGESGQGGLTMPVEVMGGVRTVAQLKALVVGAPAGPAGAPTVLLGDVAAVAQGQRPIDGISRRDGLPALQVEVFGDPNGSAVALSDDVRSRMARLHLASGDDLQLLSDTAQDIRASLGDLVLEGLAGAFLAVAVIFLFLRSVRATLVTAIALPTSVLVALLGTALAGFSVNILTLAGLTIAIGRIVDDAIVVLENSHRHLQLGEPPLEAAERGAAEVSSAVISSTLTTVCVFLPIGLAGGLISRFFLPFSLTVTLSLLASLVVALTLVPVLVSAVLPRRAGLGDRGPLADAAPNALARAYRPLVAWSLARGWRKAAILAAALALLAGSAATLVAVPRNSFDVGGSTEIDGVVSLPPGTAAEQTSQRLLAFESAARADPVVRHTQVTIGSAEHGGQLGAFTSNEAFLTVWVRSKDEARPAAQRLQARLDQFYGPGSAQLSLAFTGPTTNTFSVSLQGTDPAALREASDRVVSALAGDHELANVQSDLAPATPELLVSVDPVRATAHGLSPQAVADLVSAMLGSTDVGTLGPAGPAISLRLDPASVSADRLPALPVGEGVVLGDVAAVSRTLAPTDISRTDAMQQVGISAQILTADTQGASDRAQRLVDRLALPAGVSFGNGGGGLDISTAFNQMIVAIGIAIPVVFLVLVAFFRSLVTPFVILLTMPLALIGSLLTLYLSGQALGLPALLGVLMLFGIVVSNAILLIDFVERDRADRPLAEALILAGSVRVRPILMTALATIVALAPVSAGLSTAGGGGLISRPLALVVEGGLISSTFLTLLVVPIVYSLLRPSGGRHGPRVVP